MTEQNKKVFLEEFERETRIAIRRLETDAFVIARLIGLARDENPERELEIRREIRPIAVELLYMVIGIPKTFEEVLGEMEQQEDDHDR